MTKVSQEKIDARAEELRVEGKNPRERYEILKSEFPENYS